MSRGSETSRTQSCLGHLRPGSERPSPLDDLLTFVHPQVSWYPVTRPGRTAYTGHVGTGLIHADIRRARGEFRIAFDELVELGDGRVGAHVRLMQMTEKGEVSGPSFGLVITLRSSPKASAWVRLSSNLIGPSWTNGGARFVVAVALALCHRCEQGLRGNVRWKSSAKVIGLNPTSG
jgi:hypothetical protein